MDLAIAIANDGERRHSIEMRAYQLWEERGRPWNSPEVDWFAAERDIDELHSGQADPESSTVTAAKVVGSVLGSVAGLVNSLVDPLQHGSEP